MSVNDGSDILSEGTEKMNLAESRSRTFSLSGVIYFLLL